LCQIKIVLNFQKAPHRAGPRKPDAKNFIFANCSESSGKFSPTEPHHSAGTGREKRREALRSGMWNSMVVAFASLLTLVGLILLPLPVPAGALVFATGLTLLISRSPRTAGTLRWLRIRWALLDRGLAMLENFSPRQVAEILRRTRP